MWRLNRSQYQDKIWIFPNSHHRFKVEATTTFMINRHRCRWDLTASRARGTARLRTFCDLTKTVSKLQALKNSTTIASISPFTTTWSRIAKNDLSSLKKMACRWEPSETLKMWERIERCSMFSQMIRWPWERRQIKARNSNKVPKIDLLT